MTETPAHSPSRPPALAVPKARARRVKLLDRTASGVIRFGGAMVIVAVAAIFLFVGREALPLFYSAKSKQVSTGRAPDFATQPGAVVGVDEYETFVYWLNPTGAIHVFTLDGWKEHRVLTGPNVAKGGITAAYRGPSRDRLYIGTRDGNVLLAQVKFEPVYTESGRTLNVQFREDKSITVSEAGRAVVRVFGRHDAEEAHVAALTEDGRLYTISYEEGDDPKVEPIGGEWSGQVTAIALDADGRKLFLATDDGKLHHWYLEESLEKPVAVLEAGTSARHISALEYVIGDNALLLGFTDGTVEQWFGVREKEDDVVRSFRRIRSFEPLPSAITRLQPSGRDKGFIAASKDGTLRLFFTTSERTLLREKMPGEINGLVYAPKLTGVLATTREGAASHWAIHNPHPEISWGTLFGKVWYEGYDRPEYVWQSTGGSDDFESKFSLVPLTVGTLKGAFYGLLFAIPIAVLAALYTSQFMHFRVRALVKPTVEIMAALPSVVIGFLAGLWLAPVMERHVVSIFAAFVVTPLLVVVAVSAWHHIPGHTRAKVPHGMELGLIIPIVAAGVYLGVQAGPWLEGIFFKGDLRQWVFDVFGQQFEQRNSIVIGFAMGFAVIPIIFTISEDALSNVPRHFVSGSLALGASRWQTATRVILPTASPGIFSAIMIGFGRAVGETMIVLMATGNTPILSFSPFNGMRTLSANIAVEIPEAPEQGTLYRVLFLAAILLFVMTFAVNTVAELIRQHLREKYKAV